MGDYATAIGVLVICLCGFSIILTSASKKQDPFLLTRPMWRYGMRWFGRFVTLAYKTLKGWMKNAWTVVKDARQSPLMRMIAAAAFSALVLLVALFLLLVDIIGRKK